VLTVAPIGLFIAARDGRHRATALIAAFVWVYYFALNASYYYWEGGWAYGPRQLMSALPFLALGLGPLWDASRKWMRYGLIAAWIWGAALTLVAVSTNPQPPADLQSPVTELLWPAFRDGDLALNTQKLTDLRPPGGMRDSAVPRASWNLGQLIGLRGHASLLPLGLVWLAGGLLLAYRGRSADGSPS
jgi:hypothetical protein